MKYKYYLFITIFILLLNQIYIRILVAPLSQHLLTITRMLLLLVLLILQQQRTSFAIIVSGLVVTEVSY